jgi:Flp pilus assembly protein TadD
LPGDASDDTLRVNDMEDHQAQFDDAMFDYSTGAYQVALDKFKAILDVEPDHFDARLGLAMSYYRMGDFASAIAEGHRAEKLRPNEQLVHTNLSLFYMKSGDKQTAEKHGLQARIASWKDNMTAPGAKPAEAADPELQMAQPKLQSFKLPEKFPDQPWKKNAKPGQPPATPPPQTPPPPAAS